MPLRRAWVLGLGLGLGLGLVTTPVIAGPPGDRLKLVERPQPVIPPGREALANALLAAVPDDPQVRFVGPMIEMDAIAFELVDADENLLAHLRLEPAGRAKRGEPTSESFVIRTMLAQGTDRERTDGAAAVTRMLDAAIASVQAHDNGGFYIHPELAERIDRQQEKLAAADPEANRTRWAWETGALALALLVGVGLLLRPQTAPITTAGSQRTRGDRRAAR